MVQINFAHKEIQCKVVYYGPGMSGKTTNLELVHEKTPKDSRGELTSIATTGERTLYFDYMPLDLGSIAGIRTKFQLYTVPGQIYYKSTRRLVLQGVDGIVFVADSAASKIEENRESLRDLEENLKEMGRSIKDLPIVIQYNKRDLPDALSIDDLQKQVNVHGFPHFEAVATSGQGIFPTLKALAGLVLEAVNRGGLGAARAPRASQAGLSASQAGVPLGAPPAAASAAAPVPVPAPAARVATGFAAPLPAASRVGAVVGASAQGPVPAPMAAQRTAPPPSNGYLEPSPVRMGTGTGTATQPAPRRATPPPVPAPAPRPTSPAPRATPPPVATRATPAPAPAARPAPTHASPLSSRSVDERMVRVNGLGRPSGGGKTAAILGLLALVAAAAWFVLTRLN